jgi:hypothetical protein
MTTAGWVFISLSWGVIIGLGVFCFLKIFINNKKEASEGKAKIK